MDNATIARKLPEAMADPKAWVLTGTRGIYAYPRGEEESDQTVKQSTIGAAKLIVETLVRTILGL
ncbi:MAG TPA: hypothetical protein VFY96_11500 [Candidatus Binatia bacterium]|nr:hypothetical protein [Candidatus Binatia bacterium]